MNLLPKLEGVAKACAGTAVEPRDAGCCGLPGERSFLCLPESATR